MADRLLPLNIAELCAHALELERACERRLSEYAVRMRAIRERTVALAFERMAQGLREEIAGLASASGDRKPALLSPWEYAWRLAYMPDAVQDRPEVQPATAREALQLAVQARQRASAFYTDVAENAGNSLVRATASEMASNKFAAQQRLERMLAYEIRTGSRKRQSRRLYELSGNA